MPRRKIKPVPFPFSIEELKIWHSHDDDCICDICKEVNEYYGVIYDEEHKEYIDVTVNNPKLKKLVDDDVKVK